MIKKLVILLAVAILFSGCATVKVKKTGTECEASYTSVLKSFDGINMAACGAEGGADKSKSDIDIVIGALIEALIGGQ